MSDGISDSTKVMNALVEYEKPENKNLIQKFTPEQIEKGLIRCSRASDKERPFYPATEMRLQELKDHRTIKERRKDKVIGFITGAIIASLPDPDKPEPNRFK